MEDKKKIWALSNLNSNRSRGCPIPIEKQTSKSGRDHIEEIVDREKKDVITAWHASKRVHMLSNYIGKDLVDICQRFDHKGGSKIDVERPASVKTYNTFMGGVDKAEILCHSTEQSLDQESGIIKLRFTYSAWQYATPG